MKLTFSFIALLNVALVAACGDDAWRCVNPNGKVDGDNALTQFCKMKLGMEDCYCSHRAETYVNVGDKLEDFKACCKLLEGFSYRQC